MTGDPAGRSPRAVLRWPNHPDLFESTTNCPACFAALGDTRCAQCGLDLAVPLATELLAAGERIAQGERERRAILARMYVAQAARERDQTPAAERTPRATPKRPLVPPAGPPVPAIAAPAPAPAPAPAANRPVLPAGAPVPPATSPVPPAPTPARIPGLPAPIVGQPGRPTVAPAQAAVLGTEASGPRRSGVQIFLLTLGVVLVSVTAIFFLFVAYMVASLEMRSIMTAAASVAVLGVAWLLQARGLRGTGEGVAVVAVVLLLLDAWIVRANGMFGSYAVDGPVYYGLALLVIAGFLAATSVRVRLRVPTLVATGLAPLGASLLTLGLLWDAEAVGLLVALVVLGACGLAARFVRPAAEATVLRTAGFVGTALTMLTAGLAFEDDPGLRAVGFAAAAVLWWGHLAAIRTPEAALGRSRFVAAVGAGASLALIPSMALGRVDEWVTMLVPPTAAAVVAVALLGVRRRLATWHRAAALVAACAAGVIAVVGIVPAFRTALLIVSSSLPAELWRERRSPFYADVDPTAVGLASAAALVIVAVALGAGLSLAGVLARFVAVSAGVGAFGLLTACVALPWPEARAAALVALAVVGLVLLAYAPRRLTLSSGRPSPSSGRPSPAVRIVVAASALAGVALLFASGFSDVRLWPWASAGTVLVLLLARVLLPRILAEPEHPGMPQPERAGVQPGEEESETVTSHWVAGHGAGLLGGALTGVAGVVVVIVGLTLPLWLSATGVAPGALRADAGPWVAVGGTGVIAALAWLRSRLPRPDVDALGAASVLALVVGAVNTELPREPLMLGVQLVACVLVVLAAILWNGAGRATQPGREWLVQRSALAVLAPVALSAASMLIVRELFGTGVAVGVAVAIAAVASAALALVLFGGSADLPRSIWEVATGALGILAVALSWSDGSGYGWIGLVIVALVPLMLAGGSLLHGGRRSRLAWAALPLATAGLWSRLSDAGVAQIEPYTLPLAAVLALLAGLALVFRPLAPDADPNALEPARTLLAASALGIAIVPSAVVSYADGPARGVVLVVGGLVLTTIGTLLPALFRGLPLRPLIGAAGVVAALGGGGVRAAAELGERGVSGVEIEAWLAPGLFAAALLAVRGTGVTGATRFASVSIDGALRQGAVLAALSTFAAIELLASAFNQHADVRALLAVSVAGALYVASVAVDAPALGRVVERGSIGIAAVLAALGAFASTGPIELVSVPLGLALFGAGLMRLAAHPELRTWPQLGYACGVLLLPSLFVGFVDSPLWRLVGLGVVAIALVVAGFARGWQAPLVFGGAVLLVHAVAQLWPWISAVYTAVPWWLWLGVGGVLLIVLAATYEHRIRNFKSAARSLSSLR